MFIAFKILLYLVAAHMFYNHGIEPEKDMFDFVVIMSCYVLIDICSYFNARQALLQELFEGAEEDETD